ncbi:Abi-alpha family protein [Nocardioides sp. HDW12B]|uniref:Abi-alpha family protein n=1 Tax=Nocardioides sp. HDW12B TaxID=2714939 RepID=UPI00198208EB|nr:Abi-alpha family protein [Nocardioides sp. HDW12B]
MSLERRAPAGEPDGFGARDVVGLAKVVTVSGFRVGAWAAYTGLSATRRVVDVALHPDHAWELAEDVRYAAGAVTRAMVGDRLDDVRAAAAGNPVVRVVAETLDNVTPSQPPAQPDPEPENPLHAAGRDLLHRSRDVWADDHGHPAYARIIEELAPDEGRILLLLLRRGPQAAVDVRTGGLIGAVSSTLVAPQLNMIGAHAGCRYVDRVPSYLHNLERLGLIWFSPELVTDPMDYQVLEAQPDVIEAMESVKRAKCVRRSLHLTPFGEDFCREGLGLHLSTEELAEVPKHANPAQD